MINLSNITISIFGTRVRYATNDDFKGHLELTDHKGYVRDEGKVMEGVAYTFQPYSTKFPPVGFIKKKLDDITIEDIKSIYNG